MVNDKDSEKSETETETSESMIGLNFPHEFYALFPNFNILADLNEKDKNHPKFQAKFKRSRYNNKYVFIFSQN